MDGDCLLASDYTMGSARVEILLPFSILVLVIANGTKTRRARFSPGPRDKRAGPVSDEAASDAQ